jgi:hypothetical protein
MVSVSLGVANSQGDLAEGWQDDAHRYGCGRGREIDISISISSSFNVSLVSDTSTPSSFTKDLSLSLPPFVPLPPQPSLPAFALGLGISVPSKVGAGEDGEMVPLGGLGSAEGVLG